MWQIYVFTFSIYGHQIFGYVSNLVCIFVSCTYLAVTYNLDIAVGCILVCRCRNLVSVCPFSIMAVGHIWSVVATFVQ